MRQAAASASWETAQQNVIEFEGGSSSFVPFVEDATAEIIGSSSIGWRATSASSCLGRRPRRSSLLGVGDRERAAAAAGEHAPHEPLARRDALGRPILRLDVPVLLRHPPGVRGEQRVRFPGSLALYAGSGGSACQGSSACSQPSGPPASGRAISCGAHHDGAAKGPRPTILGPPKVRFSPSVRSPWRLHRRDGARQGAAGFVSSRTAPETPMTERPSRSCRAARSTRP